MLPLALACIRSTPPADVKHAAAQGDSLMDDTA